MDFYTKSDIESDFTRIAEIVNCQIFSEQNLANPLRRSAFIEVCILLNDLLAKSAKYSNRISFIDDIAIIPNQVEDITDLVSKVRNAVCHIPSVSHLIGNRETSNKFTFSEMIGKGILATINDVDYSSDYEDDIAFFIGEYRIYLRRHIIRAYNEAQNSLVPLL